METKAVLCEKILRVTFPENIIIPPVGITYSFMSFMSLLNSDIQCKKRLKDIIWIIKSRLCSSELFICVVPYCPTTEQANALKKVKK